MIVATVIPTHLETTELLITVTRVSNPIVVFDNFYAPLFSTQLEDLGATVVHGVFNNSYKARNAGIVTAIEKFNAEFILFTDGDCIVEPDWEREMLLVNSDIVVGYTNEIGGSKLLDVYRKNPYGLGTNSIKFWLLGENRFTTCNVGYRTSVLVKNNLFGITKDDEDFQMSQRAILNGASFRICPHARLNHFLCSGVSSYFKKKHKFNFVVSYWAILFFPFAAITGLVHYIFRSLLLPTKEQRREEFIMYLGFLLEFGGFTLGKIKKVLGYKSKRLF